MEQSKITRRAFTTQSTCSIIQDIIKIFIAALNTLQR